MNAPLAPHGHAPGTPPYRQAVVHQPAGQSLAFKFTFVRNGNAASVFAKDGMVTPEGLILDGLHLPHACILDTDTRDRRVVLTLGNPQWVDQGLHGFVEEGFLVLEVRKPGARLVEMAIDRVASYLEAEAKRQQLMAEGREHEFRVATCPGCHATVDLSGLPDSEYYYCRFCCSIHHHHRPLPVTDHYRTCDECSMFDRNQSYTEFYFYFLLVVYGFRVSRRHMCDNCAGGLFWKTFLINFVFVLGVPSAIWVKLKSVMRREPTLKELANANRRALKGDAGSARAMFAQLHQVLPNHPGLHTNEARAHLEAGDGASAHASLQHALGACPSYRPAQDMMRLLAGT